MVIVKDGKEIKLEGKVCPICKCDLQTWKELFPKEEHRCWERKPEETRC